MIWYQGPFILACIAISVASSYSNIPTLTIQLWQDKVFHAIAFGILALLALRAFRFQSSVRILASRPEVSAVAFSAFYGVLDEIHQSYVPGRTTDPWDVVADVAGALIALGLARMVTAVKKGSVSRRPIE
jgi:VanZ family protein